MPDDKNDYEKHLDAIDGAGGYFTFREVYLNIMSRDAAIVLQKCINRYSYFLKKDLLEEDGYFPISAKQLSKLQMNKSCQARVLNQLQGWTDTTKAGKKVRTLDEDAAFLKVVKRGIPPRRFVWIDFPKIDLALNKCLKVEKSQPSKVEKSQPSKVEKSQPLRNLDQRRSRNLDQRRSRNLDHLTSEIKTVETTPKPCSPARNGSAVPRPANGGARAEGFITGGTGGQRAQNTFAHACTVQLYNALVEKDLITHSRGANKERDIAKTKKVWVAHFSALQEHHSESEIKEVLDWYVKNIRGDRVPHFFCARTFCEGFIRLREIIRLRRDIQTRAEKPRLRPGECEPI